MEVDLFGFLSIGLRYLLFGVVKKRFWTSTYLSVEQVYHLHIWGQKISQIMAASKRLPNPITEVRLTHFRKTACLLLAQYRKARHPTLPIAGCLRYPERDEDVPDFKLLYRMLCTQFTTLSHWVRIFEICRYLQLVREIGSFPINGPSNVQESLLSTLGTYLEPWWRFLGKVISIDSSGPKTTAATCRWWYSTS